MGKLLAKEGNVTKVPVHTYGEREREREKKEIRILFSQIKLRKSLGRMKYQVSFLVKTWYLHK